MDLFTQIAQKIIEAQEQVIGPVAVQQARAVEGLTLNWDNNHGVEVTDMEHAAQVLNNLVNRYEALFGPIARETSKEAARRYSAQLPSDQVPKSLQ